MKYFLITGLFSVLLFFPSASQAQHLATSRGFTVSICPDSSVWSWGFARLGDEPGATRKLTPVQVKGPGGQGFFEGASAVAIGSGSAYLVHGDGSLWSWGSGSNGRLGTGNTSNQDFPTQVLGPNGVMDSAVIVASHSRTSYVLRENGTVWGWGANGSGQVGDGSNNNSRSTPVQVVERTTLIPLDSIIGISAGVVFGVALDEDGSVWAWGDDNNGEIGQNTVGQQYRGAVKVKSPSGTGFFTDIVEVKAGDNFVVALRNDGTVWAWGDGTLGQLGDGTFLSSDVPVQVRDTSGQFFLQNITAIGAGYDHGLAMDSLGNFFSWGDNTYGQMRDPLLPSAISLPIQITIPGNKIEVFADGNSSGAILDSEELIIWGDNQLGNFGNNDQLIEVLSPQPVINEDNSGALNNISAISTGEEHQLALVGGQVFHWGDGVSAYTGAAGVEVIISPRPVKVPGPLGTGFLSGIQKIAAAENHRVALGSNGVPYGWGNPTQSQLGTSNVSWVELPRTFQYFDGTILQGVSDIAAGPRVSMFLMNDSTVRYVGFPGSPSKTYPFLQLSSSGGPPLDGITQIAAGFGSMLALDKDSVIWAWGLNTSSQLGDGTSTNRSFPVQVKDTSGNGVLTGVVKIDAFEENAFALTKDGFLYGWGNNNFGETGSGDQLSSALPRIVLDSTGLAPLTNIVDVAAGALFSMALASDSTVWVWGLNARGNFGDSTKNNSLLPVKVLDLDGSSIKNVIGIDAGSLLGTLQMADGTMRSFGYNLDGQTGVYPSFGETKVVSPFLTCRLIKPEAGFVASQLSACEGTCIQFTDTSSISTTKRTWIFEGANIQHSSDPSPTVCYANPGSFSVTLIVENLAGVDTLTQTGLITINPVPIIDAGIDTMACVGDSITLMASGGQTYSWSASNALSCLPCSDPILLVTNTSSYIVTGIDANGCSKSDTVFVEANPLPVASAGPDQSVCLGDSVQLQGSGGDAYLWSPGSNASCTSCADPKIEITTTGEFILQVTDVNGCVDLDTVVVSIDPLPTAGFSFVLDSSAFTINTSNLSQDADEIIWTFGDGGSDTAATASHTYAANGEYDLCMIAVNECGRDTFCQQVEILSVGIEEQLVSEILTIDPNPSSGPVILRFSRDAKEGEILISDLQGKVVQRIPIRPTKGMAVEAALSLPSGMYLYWFESNDLRTSATSILIRR